MSSHGIQHQIKVAFYGSCYQTTLGIWKHLWRNQLISRQDLKLLKIMWPLQKKWVRGPHYNKASLVVRACQDYESLLEMLLTRLKSKDYQLSWNVLKLETPVSKKWGLNTVTYDQGLIVYLPTGAGVVFPSRYSFGYFKHQEAPILSDDTQMEELLNFFQSLILEPVEPPSIWDHLVGDL